MGSLSELEIFISGERTATVKMVSAILALHDKETIDIQKMQYHAKIEVEEGDTIYNVIGIIFNFITFEQEKEVGESVDPYLEKLREQGEKIVAQLLDMPKGDKTKKVIIRPARYKPLEFPVNQ